MAASVTPLLASLWSKNEPLMRERLAILEQAAQAADAGSLTPELREEATSISHKLAGSLGMFGFPRGTDIARTLEQAFEREAPISYTQTVATLKQALFPND